MTIKIVLTALMIVSVDCQLLSCCLGSLGDDLFDFMRTGITGRELAKPAKPQTNAQINWLWQTKPNLAGRGGGRVILVWLKKKHRILHSDLQQFYITSSLLKSNDRGETFSFSSLVSADIFTTHRRNWIVIIEVAARLEPARLEPTGQSQLG